MQGANCMSDEIDAGCQREQEDTAKDVAASREVASRIELDSLVSA